MHLRCLARLLVQILQIPVGSGRIRKLWTGSESDAGSGLNDDIVFQFMLFLLEAYVASTEVAGINLMVWFHIRNIKKPLNQVFHHSLFTSLLLLALPKKNLARKGKENRYGTVYIFRGRRN